MSALTEIAHVHTRREGGEDQKVCGPVILQIGKAKVTGLFLNIAAHNLNAHGPFGLQWIDAIEIGHFVLAIKVRIYGQLSSLSLLCHVPRKWAFRFRNRQ